MSLLGLIKRNKQSVVDNSKNQLLKEVYKDKRGVKFYGFIDPLNIPTLRALAAERAARYATMFMNEKTFNGLVEEMKKAGGKNDWVKVFTIIQEMEIRGKFLAEEETLLEIAGLYYLLKDENPAEVIETLTIKKIDMWRNDSESRTFFLSSAMSLTKQYSDMEPGNILLYLEANREHSARLNRLISTKK